MSAVGDLHGSPRDLVALPRAAVLMLWAGAYLRGDVGPDDAAELSYGVGRSGPAEGADLFSWLTGLRRLPLAQLRLALPVPGRIAGLVGPPPAVSSALENEQAVVVTAAGLAEHTLIPQTETVSTLEGHRLSVSWERFAAPLGADLAPPASSGTGREELLSALRSAADSSIDLDLVPEEPVEPARVPPTWTATGLPRHVDEPAAHLLVLAARTLLLTRAEMAEGPARSVHLGDQAARRELLGALQDASRTALIEAVERVAQPEAC